MRLLRIWINEKWLQHSPQISTPGHIHSYLHEFFTEKIPPFTDTSIVITELVFLQIDGPDTFAVQKIFSNGKIPITKNPRKRLAWISSAHHRCRISSPPNESCTSLLAVLLENITHHHWIVRRVSQRISRPNLDYSYSDRRNFSFAGFSTLDALASIRLAYCIDHCGTVSHFTSTS